VMFEAETPGKDAGEIIQLLEAGYVLNERLLRPARVGVAKAGATEHKIDTSA
jgi:molecular chaperone GrpE